jgi:predicted transcriptional regulator
MSTTTIRIEDDLKARVAASAARSGKTPHAFIVDAIAQTVAQAELDDELHRIAEERWAELMATSKTVPWEEAKGYLKAKAAGGNARRPAARKFGR